MPSFTEFLQKSGISEDAISAFETAIVAVKEDADAQNLESKGIGIATTETTQITLEALQDLVKSTVNEIITVNNTEIATGFIEFATIIKSLREELTETRQLLNKSLASGETEVHKQIEQASPASLSWIIKGLTSVSEEHSDSVPEDIVKQISPRVGDGTSGQRTLSQPSILFSNIANGGKK